MSKISVIEANKIVYAKAAEIYNKTEPHFLPENQAKVKTILVSLRNKTGPRLLDVGCGTGFIINLAKDLFEEIHGVDVSKEMLDQVDVSGGKVHLHNIAAEKLPFGCEYFDMVTAYAFLHHLKDYKEVLKESYRVLKTGGFLYVDLEPNKKYDQLVKQYRNTDTMVCSDLVRKELRSICFPDLKVEEDYGISGEIFNISEYTRHTEGGIDADNFALLAKQIGFASCDVYYQWFPGQGKIMHQQSEGDATIIDNYLREIFPFSQSLFKYLRFIIRK